MSAAPDGFDRNVFINCPFDAEYAPILQAMMFCIVYLGFRPRLATETIDGAESRLARIERLVEASRFSIHDLSRCRAAEAGEFYRLNMPLELGFDYACRKHAPWCAAKRILVLEEERHRFRAAISDLSGCDVQEHDGKYGKAIRKVRNWLVSEGGADRIGADRIAAAYEGDFQQWHVDRQRAAGFSEEDVRDTTTAELLEAMTLWREERP